MPSQPGGDREQILIAPRKFRKGKSFTSQRGHRIDSRGAPGRQQAGHRSHGRQQRRSGQQNERARALADEVFAPRQQREQLDPEIGNKESSECDRWNAHKRIPEYGRHAGMKGVEYDDMRQIHAIAHARKIVYQSPYEMVAAIRMKVSEEQQYS